MDKHIRRFKFGTGSAKVVFVVGRGVREHIDNDKRSIFGSSYNFSAYIASADRAVEFYNLQLQSYRKAVDSWTIVGLRNCVVKDIRKMIGKMIWDMREEALYK
jgi:hypothetical protein